MLTRSRGGMSVLAVGVVLAVGALSVAYQPERTAPAPAAQPAGKQDQPDRSRRPDGRGGEPANLEGVMKGMNRALKRLASQVVDASKKDDNLRLIGEVERACVTAKGMPLPEDVLEKAPDDAGKAKMSAEFRHELIAVMRKLLDLEQNIADGKLDEAKAGIAELKKMRDAGHEKLGVKKDD